MLNTYIHQGIRRARSRPGLIALLYVVHLGLAGLVAFGVYRVVNVVLADTGFSQELAAQFNIVLWADAFDRIGPGLRASLRRTAWLILSVLLWKLVSSVGLIHALRTAEEPASFWRGAFRYTPRALLLGALYLILLAGFVAALLTLDLFIGGGGEVRAFWRYAVGFPTVFITGVAVLDLMHDYSRMYLVLENRPVLHAWLGGLQWPFAHGRASRVYVAWFAVAGLLWALPFVIGLGTARASLGAIVAVWLVQQGFLVLRQAAGVAWFGSEVALFEEVREPWLRIPEEEERADNENAAENDG